MNRRNLLAVVAPLVLWIGGSPGCSGSGSQNSNGNSNSNDNTAGTGSLLYVLQPETVPVQDMVASAFQWLVIEPSRSGDAASEFTADQVRMLREDGPCGGKTVLAYLSIGEAEDYRDYFDPAWVDGGVRVPGVAPDWLGPGNPDFPGNYKVRYWDPGWQALILGTAAGAGKTPLDRIIDAGYDGVYLDIIDAYDFWSSPEGGAELTRDEARRRMIAWVTRISEYARGTRGAADFLVFPQNGSDIIRDDQDRIDDPGEDYFTAIHGIGIEDLYYDGTTPQPAGETQYVLDQLTEYRSHGKTVLVTDYIIPPDATTPGAVPTEDSTDRLNDFHSRASSAGFIAYAAHANRDLDVIVTLSTPQWPVAQPPPTCP